MVRRLDIELPIASRCAVETLGIDSTCRRRRDTRRPHSTRRYADLLARGAACCAEPGLVGNRWICGEQSGFEPERVNALTNENKVIYELAEEREKPGSPNRRRWVMIQHFRVYRRVPEIHTG